LVVVLLVRRVRSSDERLVEHLSKESPGAQRPPAAGRLGLSFAAALLCVALGFVLVLLLAVYRIGTP
jgi:hypothetical protein